MELLFVFLGIIGTWILINSAFKLGRRSVRATERQTQMLYDAMTPEAQERIEVARIERDKKAREAGYVRALGILILVIIAILYFAAGH